MAKTKTPDRRPTAADHAPKSQTKAANFSNGDIARRAYDLYLARGCVQGHDVEDWLQAERELNGAANSAAA